MKFKYYIVDLFEGEIVGTDDPIEARNIAGSVDFFVVDADAGEWLQAGGSRVPVEGV